MLEKWNPLDSVQAQQRRRGALVPLRTRHFGLPRARFPENWNPPFSETLTISR
jgi:hypothetical protein